jgi:hypothetical protein
MDSAPALKFPLSARLTQFDASHEVRHALHAIEPGAGERQAEFCGAVWTITADWTVVDDRPDAIDGSVTFQVRQGQARDIAVGLEWQVDAWSRETFVMIPAAAYNGNRYPCRPYSYPPMVHEPADIGPDASTLVTDVPRLNDNDHEPSRLQLLTGDATTPCISFYDPRRNEAAILLTRQGSRLGNHGLVVEETLDRSSAVMRIEAPGVRRDTLYTMCRTTTPSWDRGATFRQGDSLTLRFRLLVFPADSVQALYDRFAEVRGDLVASAPPEPAVPFSTAFEIIDAKYQRDNWDERGYYRVGVPHEGQPLTAYHDWQLGWVGGGIVPLAFILNGSAASRRRAVRNIDWMFTSAQHASGLFHVMQHRGERLGDGYQRPGTKDWYMVRKQSDALYFLVKSFYALQGGDGDWTLPTHWAEGTVRLGDRLCDTFRRYGQLGQYLHAETGDVLVGGSAAGGMAIGGLALGGQWFSRDDWIASATALADRLDAEFVRRGITTGGPGEILKCADSESAFAILESFVVLYEVTGDSHWLERARAIANQCLTWCASYDYQFPPQSWLGRLAVRAGGSVWANVQNKHSAPGICTLSGDALFKLFRYTGQTLYLDQIRQTAHNLPQYLSRADRPFGEPESMKPGFITERVNFSDWEGVENVGGNLFGSCWPEVSMLLTAVEIPGIYFQPDSGLLAVFDHVRVRVAADTCDQAVLECENPTTFTARVRVFVETAQQAEGVLEQAAIGRCPTVEIPANTTVRLPVRAGRNTA